MADDVRDNQAGGSPRDQSQDGMAAAGRQAGGGPSAPDRDAAGGSSGAGGYGKAEKPQSYEAQLDALSGQRSDEDLTRGERLDEQQGGGRGEDEVSAPDDLAADQAAHQDRGQSVAEVESDNR